MRPLLSPSRLYTRAEILAPPSAAPSAPGVYAWYFRTAPPGVPLHNVHSHEGCVLLYVGISPCRPPIDATKPSRQSLRKRLRAHYRGNASGSTLRLTFSVLLAEELGIRQMRVGGALRRTFADGEQTLSEWMAEHALVCWFEHAAPWEEEARLISQLDLPFNLAGNRYHPHAVQLTALRAAARARA